MRRRRRADPWLGRAKLLRQSFIHLPRIGKVTEGEIWETGIRTWDDFLGAVELPARINGKRSYLRTLVEQSTERYERRDAAYFDAVLPSREMWRLYPDFRERAAFVDIETTGLSPERSIITLIGVLDVNGYTAFVQDENLADFREAMEQYELIVTFNGAAFDLPCIEYHFGSIFSSVAHIDLRFPLKRAGFSGGLKSIERQARVGRPSELSALSGYDAVLLWRMWRQGNRGARDTLVRYNAEDVASLPALAELTYNKLAGRLLTEVRSLSATHRHEIDLPYDIDVIEHLQAMKSGTRRAY